jgi:prepilin-type N-terminal cleavage/methylation domain-containing protein
MLCHQRTPLRFRTDSHCSKVTARNAGLTLIELMVVLAILTIALSMFSRTLVSSARLDPLNSETVIAGEAARSKLEEMRNNRFEDIYVLFNSDPADDPGGAGTAPGDQFLVDNLDPIAGQAFIGTVFFPEQASVLREDVVNEMLGMPRDLNADGIVDADPRADDYLLLPVRIRIEWSGRGGDRNLEMHTLFADL